MVSHLLASFVTYILLNPPPWIVTSITFQVQMEHAYLHQARNLLASIHPGRHAMPGDVCGTNEQLIERSRTPHAKVVLHLIEDPNILASKVRPSSHMSQ